MRWRSGFCSALGAVLLLACGAGEAPPSMVEEPPPPERAPIVEPGREDVRLSPDGTRLAYLAPALVGRSLWLAPVDDPAAARPVGEDGDPGRTFDFRWAYAGDRVLWLRESAGVPRLFAVAGATGESRPLTPADRAARVVHLSPSRPDTAVVELAGAAGEPGDLHLLDLASGDLELLEANDRFVDWAVDRDLDLRLAFEDTGDGVRVSQRAETGGWADHSWVPADEATRTRFLGFDAGGEVAFFLDGRGRDGLALVASNVISGRAEVLFQSGEKDVDEVVFHPVDGTPQAAAAGRYGQRWLVLDEAVRDDLDRLRGVAEGALEIVDRSLDDDRWLVAVVPWAAPRQFYLYRRDTGETELLFGATELVAAAGLDAAAGETATASSGGA